MDGSWTTFGSVRVACVRAGSAEGLDADAFPLRVRVSYDGDPRVLDAVAGTLESRGRHGIAALERQRAAPSMRFRTRRWTFEAVSSGTTEEVVSTLTILVANAKVLEPAPEPDAGSLPAHERAVLRAVDEWLSALAPEALPSEGQTREHVALRRRVETLIRDVQVLVLENVELLSQLDERDVFIEQLTAQVRFLEAELRRRRFDPARVHKASDAIGSLLTGMRKR